MKWIPNDIYYLSCTLTCMLNTEQGQKMDNSKKKTKKHPIFLSNFLDKIKWRKCFKNY